MSTGGWVVVVALVAALGFGLYRAAVDGRFRGTHRLRDVEPDPVADAGGTSVLAGTGWATDLGERATLLQFSSAFCAPCRATRRVLGEVAGLVPGVTHVEVDAEQHLEVVRALRVLRTPTTLILDAGGREVSRAAGLPQRDQVLAALARVS
jgi:thiol-disulfide isomerase/thioredoxin